MKLSDEEFNSGKIINKMIVIRNKVIIEDVHKNTLNEKSYSVKLFYDEFDSGKIINKMVVINDKTIIETEHKNNEKTGSIKFSDEEFSFRAIIGKMVIIKDKALIEAVHKSKLNEKSDSILTYCYVDDQAGITFEYLCPYNIGLRAMFVQRDKDYSYKLRFASVADCEILIIDSDKSGEKLIDDRIDMIKKGYKTSEDIKKFRTWGFIDHLRSKEYPDDIIVGLFKNGLEGEGLYIKLIKEENNKLFGKLLNEPYQNFGVHLHDIIEVKIGKDGNGKISCFYECL